MEREESEFKDPLLLWFCLSFINNCHLIKIGAHFTKFSKSFHLKYTEAYLEHSRTSVMEPFLAKIDNG